MYICMYIFMYLESDKVELALRSEIYVHLKLSSFVPVATGVAGGESLLCTDNLLVFRGIARANFTTTRGDLSSNNQVLA